MVVEASKVRAIQAMLDQGKSVREIARELGVGGNTVLNVRRGLAERGVLKEEQEAAARDLFERGYSAPEVADMLEVSVASAFRMRPSMPSRSYQTEPFFSLKDITDHLARNPVLLAHDYFQMNRALGKIEAASHGKPEWLEQIRAVRREVNRIWDSTHSPRVGAPRRREVRVHAHRRRR